MKNPESVSNAEQAIEGKRTVRSRIIGFALFLCLINLTSFHYFKHYESYIKGGDSWGYYIHLVSTFIYHDGGDYHATVAGTRQEYPDFEDPYKDKYGIRQSPTGHYIIKYTNGVALMLSPFFLAAHAYCKVSGHYTANGFTLPYLLALGWGVIFWTGLAYYFLIKVLRRYFSKWVVIHTLIVLVLGTNLFYNTAYSSIMSHALLFSLYCFLIYYTDVFYRNYKLSSLILMALSAAFIILVRPNELYCLHIPLFYNITNFAAVKERIQFFKVKYVQLLIAAACAFIVFIPQIFYWKKYTGSFIYNAYVGENFDFSKPHIYEGFFSYANGWLVWSPLMVLSLIGIVFSFRYARHITLPLILVFTVHVYIIYSWWCFNYINGFGSRPMEDIYPLLSFSLASFFVFMSRSNITKFIITLIVCIGVGLNIFQTWQQSKGLIFTELMNEGYYWGMFGQTAFNRKATVAYASTEIQRDGLKKNSTLYADNFDDTSEHTNVWLSEYGRTMHCLKNQIDTIAFMNIKTFGDAKYFIIKFKNLYPAANFYKYQWDCPAIIIRHIDGNGKTLYDSDMRPHILTGNATNSFWSTGTPDVCDSIEYNMKIYKRSKTKKILVCTWNYSRQPFYIDDFEISLAE